MRRAPLLPKLPRCMKLSLKQVSRDVTLLPLWASRTAGEAVRREKRYANKKVRAALVRRERDVDNMLVVLRGYRTGTL